MDQRFIASAGESCSVKFWDLATGEVASERPQDAPLTCLVRSPRGVFAGDMASEIKEWNPGVFNPLATYSGHENVVGSIAICPVGDEDAGDAPLMVSGEYCNSGTCCTWEMGEFEPVAIWEAHPQHFVTTLTCQSSSRVLTGSNDHTIRVWNIEAFEGEEMLKVDDAHGEMPVADLSFSTTSNQLASVGHDCIFKTWTPELKLTSRVRLQDVPLNQVTWVPNDDHRVLAAGRGDVLLWDVRQVRTPVWWNRTFHADWVRTIEVFETVTLRGSSNEEGELVVDDDAVSEASASAQEERKTYFVTCSRDKMILVGELETGRIVRRFIDSRPVFGAVPIVDM